MFRLTCIAVAAAVLLSPDVEQALRSPQSQQQGQIPAGQNVPVLPNFNSPRTTAGTAQSTPVSDPGQAAAPAQGDESPTLPDPPAKDAPPLTDDARLELIRFVSGEFAKAIAPLPGGKDGFHLQAGEPVNQNLLRRAVLASGAAVNSGDNAQITSLEFHDKEIVVDINGGGNGRVPLRQRIQISAGGPVSMQPVQTGENGGPPSAKKTGATLFLEFGRSLPNMTPDELKGYLSVVLDFSKQRSAALQWTQSLPPQVQEAIAEKRAAIGMDHDEVLAALGRPDKKVRERDEDGNDTEDWIYGNPPNITFVRFESDKVIKVDRYPSLDLNQ